MVQLLTAVLFSLRADVNLKRQEQMKERHGWIISPLPLWRTVNLTVCWTSVILCLGVFPSKTQSLKPFFWFTGREDTQKESRFFFCSMEWLWFFFFFPMNTFYCLVVVKIEMETQLWLEIVLLCGTELNRYSTTMCLLFFLWHMEPLGGTQQLIISLCCHETFTWHISPKHWDLIRA